MDTKDKASGKYSKSSLLIIGSIVCVASRVTIPVLRGLEPSFTVVWKKISDGRVIVLDDKKSLSFHSDGRAVTLNFLRGGSLCLTSNPKQQPTLTCGLKE